VVLTQEELALRFDVSESAIRDIRRYLGITGISSHDELKAHFNRKCEHGNYPDHCRICYLTEKANERLAERAAFRRAHAVEFATQAVATTQA